MSMSMSMSALSMAMAGAILSEKPKLPGDVKNLTRLYLRDRISLSSFPRRPLVHVL